MIFWYQKFVLIFWYQKLIFWHQKMILWYQKMIFWYQKLISDIRKWFSDITKLALKSYLAFYTFRISWCFVNVWVFVFVCFLVILAGLLLHSFHVIYLMMPVDSMITSSNGNIFRVTGPLWGEFTGYRWIPPTKACDVELSCFFLTVPE